MDGPTLTIRMQTPGYGMGDPCANCGQPASGFHGLPYFNGDLMSNDWPGDWGGRPCCEDCYERHARGELETFDQDYVHLFALYQDGAGI